MTFNAITTQTTSISPGPDPQDQGVDTDEVLCHCYFCWSLAHSLLDPQVIGVSTQTNLDKKWLFR